MSEEAEAAGQFDVVVIGSGAGGLATALAARKAGLSVCILEKDEVFGGTTALSGGIMWIPGNAVNAARGVRDSREVALTYLRHEAGPFYDQALAEAYLDAGPQMMEFFERETEMRFVPTEYPDYHAEAPGGVAMGRSVGTAPYDARELGPEMARLRKPLETITFMGMMFNSTNRELRHFFNVTRSLGSALFVLNRLVRHAVALARYGRAVTLTGGNAMVARLAKSALDNDIPIHTGTAARQLLLDGDRVTGVIAEKDSARQSYHARIGVVLACGGFAQDRARQKMAYPHLAEGGEHHSLAPASLSGEGISLAEQAGARFEPVLSHPAAWMPASLLPNAKKGFLVFPHIVDRYKPGVIAVNPQGRRFVNEADSYHDFCTAMRESCGKQPHAFLICDHRTIRKYGLGHAKPAPVPLGPHLRSGYLMKGATIRELAEKLKLDPQQLEATVERYNAAAREGKDSEFGRGSRAFNRFLGDEEHQPNPNVAPVEKGPFYAIRIVMGDIGTFDGIATDLHGQVLKADGSPVPGLYAAGNDRRSMMGGNYPGAGITLGPAMIFGYITGRHLAARKANQESFP